MIYKSAIQQILGLKPVAIRVPAQRLQVPGSHEKETMRPVTKAGFHYRRADLWADRRGAARLRLTVYPKGHQRGNKSRLVGAMRMGFDTVAGLGPALVMLFGHQLYVSVSADPPGRVCAYLRSSKRGRLVVSLASSRPGQGRALVEEYLAQRGPGQHVYAVPMNETLAAIYRSWGAQQTKQKNRLFFIFPRGLPMVCLVPRPGAPVAPEQRVTTSVTQGGSSSSTAV